MLEPNERPMNIWAVSNVGNGLGVQINVQFPEGIVIKDNEHSVNISRNTGLALNLSPTHALELVAGLLNAVCNVPIY